MRERDRDRGGGIELKKMTESEGGRERSGEKETARQHPNKIPPSNDDERKI